MRWMKLENSKIWKLEGTAFSVWLPCDAKTFVVRKQDRFGVPQRIKGGFRKLETAQRFAVESIDR